MLIFIQSGLLVSNVPVTFGWMECDGECHFQPIVTFSPALPLEAGYGVLPVEPFTAPDNPRLHGQAVVVQAEGFLAYAGQYPGPGLDAHVNLADAFAVTGTIEPALWQGVEATRWTAVPECSVFFCLVLTAACAMQWRSRKIHSR